MSANTPVVAGRDGGPDQRGHTPPAAGSRRTVIVISYYRLLGGW